jgi:branched-chain amino acid transport system substrate-binding protein
LTAKLPTKNLPAYLDLSLRPLLSSRVVRRGGFLLSLLFSLAGCAADSEPILIGWGGGPLNDSTVAPSLHTAQMAVEEINKSGGINGRPLRIVVLEDGGEADSAVRVASMLVDSGVVAVIGHIYSSTTLASAPVYNDSRNPVLQISPSATSPTITSAGEYTFRVCPSDLQYGGALARFARNSLGLSRGAILYVNNDYGRGIRRTFTEEFNRLGGTLTQLDPFLESAPEIGAYLERVTQDGSAEFIVVAANIEEGEQVLRQIRDRNIRLPIMGGDGFDGMEDKGTIAEGIYSSTVYMPTLNTEANRKFLEAYRARYPLGNPVDYSAAASYDIVYLLRDALLRSGPDRKALRDAVADIGRGSPAFQGLTGSIAFDENGDVPQLNIQIGVVRNGTLRPAEAR